MTLNDLLSDIRHVASYQSVYASGLDDYGHTLLDLGWAERCGSAGAPVRLRATPDGLDVLHVCRDVTA